MLTLCVFYLEFSQEEAPPPMEALLLAFNNTACCIGLSYTMIFEAVRRISEKCDRE